MNSIVLGAKAISLVSGLGTEILIETVKKTSTGIINTIQYISSHNTIDLTQLNNDLNTIDLENKISIINIFIEEIETKKDIKESIKSSILSLHNILEKIKLEMEDIKKEVDHHVTKYLYTWRSFDCSDKIINLKHHNEILDKRFDLLIKLLSINLI
jgi:hypothetical protein